MPELTIGSTILAPRNIMTRDKREQTMKDIYGEEYAGDSRFVAECRRLQSIYRVEIGEKIRPYTGRDGNTHYYGNYIGNGKETGANFLTRCAFMHAIERTDPKNKKPYETFDEERLFNNLLSSQPMAFNLFCPLSKLLEESPRDATLAIKAALPAYPIHEVTGIGLEFIPEEYKSLTGDQSAMDAIIRYRNEEGNEGFVAVETKYSENLGINVAYERGTKKPRAKNLEAVRMLACFDPDIEKRINDGRTKLTQIYRNFLLSERYGLEHGLISHSIILAPRIHPSTGKEVESLAKELRPEYRDKIRSVHLEDFVDRIIGCCPQDYRAVFEKFKERYLNFDKLGKQ